jgi:hypothetical protein
MLEGIIADIVTAVVAAVAGFVFGKMSMATRLEVLRLMRVVEKVLAGSGNDVMRSALLTLYAHGRDYVTEKVMSKVEQIVEDEANKMKPAVDFARRIFGGDKD